MQEDGDILAMLTNSCCFFSRYDLAMRCWQSGPQEPTLQGRISCNDTVVGNTGDPGVNNLGGPAFEHTYSFSVGWESSLNFDACASDCKDEVF